MSLLQRQAQAFRSAAPSSEGPPDKIADVPRACPQGLAEVMPDPELADDGVIVPEEEERFRHIARGKARSFREGEHLRKRPVQENIPGYAVV